MFTQFLEVFWPKAMEYIAEQGLSKALNMKDFEKILGNLQENLKLLSAKAFDVETEIKNAEDSGRKKRKREVEEWLEGVKSIEKEVDELGSEAESKGFIMRFLDGGKAAQLSDDVDKLVQQRLNFGEPVLDSRGTGGVKLLTKEMVGNDFNENLERIWKLLEDEQVSKIGVYGMGGVGKTTLARHVYNRLVQEYEGRVVWVTVSQEFTIKSLQDKIAHFLGVKLEENDGEAFRAARLDGFLSQKKITVLILDDVWNNIDMKEVGCTFSMRGCRLIITTRSLEVCHRIGCKELIQVKKLGKDEAWELFNQTLENGTQLDPQVEEIAKSMAEKCDGLPLGIMTVAGSMKGGKPIYAWEDALVELQDCVAGRENGIGEFEEVDRVLKYSFDQLKRNDERASNCFLYCSLYPEDYYIYSVELVKMFISDGLLDERRSRRKQFEQGHSILDKLVNSCLLERSCGRWMNRPIVKMHDLVRSMALKICKGKYMVRAGERSLKEITYDEEWKEDVEKVSFMGCESIEEGISPDCPRLSTLLLCGNFRLKFIPNSFFTKMQGLCTLNLSFCPYIVMLPDSVSDLTSLKALLLQGCTKLEIVPNLGKLKALKELNLSYTAIKEVPQGLEESRNLRFLSMNARGLEMLPRGLLLKLGHIQHLNLPLHIQLEIEEIESLKQLDEFCGGLKSLSGFNRFIRTRGVHATYCYSIGVKTTAHIIGFKVAKDIDLGGTTNELVLYGSNLKDEMVCGQGIAYLKIRECEGLSKCFVDDLASRFDNPTSLRKLGIWRCGGIEWILRSDGQGSQFSNTVEEIDLSFSDDVKGLVMERGEIGASTTWQSQPPVFSALRKLTIWGCNKLTKIGLLTSEFPNLEIIEVTHCGEIEEIFENEERDPTALTNLKELGLEYLPRLRKVGLHMQNILNLKSISIRHCGEIEEIFEDEGRDPLTTLSKLRKLRLDYCGKMRKAGLTVSTVPNLEIIDVTSCGEIEEIFEDEGRDPITLPKLRKLTLENLPRLKSVSKAPIISNSIEEILIRKCPRLIKKFPLHFGDPIPPPSLKAIKVEREWWESLEWDFNIHPFVTFLTYIDLHYGDLDGFLDCSSAYGQEWSPK